MSELIVEVVNVDDVVEHPNADRLELAKIKGWQCVIRKGDFKKDDKGLYIPIDSIVPEELEAKIFGPDSKVKLHKSKVKTIKLRGAISQGLLVPTALVGLKDDIKIGTDVREKLGITKYEPPVGRQQGLMGGGKTRSKKQVNANFRKYTSIENAKNYPKLFTEDDMVSVTEKIHGTNFRAGYVKRDLSSLWKKALRFFKITSEYEFVFGSHNVQLQERSEKSPTFYSTNVYAEAVEKYKLRDVLKEGEVIYGEIYGDGIQKNYSYGCESGERKMVVFDVMIQGAYQDPSFLRDFCDDRLLNTPPILYSGPFDADAIRSVLSGNSFMVPEQKTIEGGVCKPLKESSSYMGRRVLKFINDEYLLKDNTELH